MISLVAVRFPQRLGEPLKTLVQTITGRGAGGLDVLQAKRVSLRLFDTSGIHMEGSNLPRDGG